MPFGLRNADEFRKVLDLNIYLESNVGPKCQSAKGQVVV